VLYNAVEYVGLFLVVLLHEFGHALACRSVGRRVSHILLWPLGGVAHVKPPQRPGAVLWSLAAGPLVNLVLGALGMGALIALSLVVDLESSDLGRVAMSFTAINVGLFLFNMLPIYPLDGGQIARALLWFLVGRSRSLTIAAGLGVVTAALGGVLAFALLHSWWLLLIGGYAAWRSWQALRYARLLDKVEHSPRHPTARCPACGQAPPAGPQWVCANGHAYDAMAHRGVCPECGAVAELTPCVHCGEVREIAAYLAPAARDPAPA
jgi:Zn-dependent protease